MSTSKERESFAGYQQAAGKMAAFTSAANRPEISQLSEEQTRMLLDACDHSKSSYAEEVLVQDLHKLQEQFEEHERKNEADKRDQAKEKRVNRWMNVAALFLASVSEFCAVAALILQLLKG